MPKVEPMRILIEKIQDTEYLIDKFDAFLAKNENTAYLDNISMKRCPELYQKIRNVVFEEKQYAEARLAVMVSNGFVFPDEPDK